MLQSNGVNSPYIAFHLREAAEEIQEALERLKAETLSPEGFRVAMAHLYHHINTAWNARNATPEQAKACSEEDFEAWRQYPQDLEIL